MASLSLLELGFSGKKLQQKVHKAVYQENEKINGINGIPFLTGGRAPSLKSYDSFLGTSLPQTEFPLRYSSAYRLI